MSMRSIHRRMSKLSSEMVLCDAMRAISTAAASWSKPRATCRAGQSAISDQQSAISNQQSASLPRRAISNQQSAISNPQSAISDQHLRERLGRVGPAISNPQSAVRNPHLSERLGRVGPRVRERRDAQPILTRRVLVAREQLQVALLALLHGRVGLVGHFEVDGERRVFIEARDGPAAKMRARKQRQTGASTSEQEPSEVNRKSSEVIGSNRKQSEASEAIRSNQKQSAAKMRRAGGVAGR